MRVQHHPHRAALLPSLLAALEPLNVEVIEEVGAALPWHAYRACLTNPPDTEYLVILQDDVLPCHDFPERCAATLKRADGHAVALFVPTTSLANKPAVHQALQRGDPLVPITTQSFCPVVAFAWPTRLIPSFLEWAANRYPDGPKLRKTDDAIVGDWANRTRTQILAAVPSLVEHPDEVRSLTGSRSISQSPRKAISFIDG